MSSAAPIRPTSPASGRSPGRRGRRREVPDLATDSRAAARVAGLRYVTDTGAGIRRRRSGHGFSYTGVDGQSIRDRELLRWIRSLAVPPAWTHVWISPVRNGHILATGRDAKGRKQFRYHPAWRETRDEAKYSRTIAFAQALPTIRGRVEEDLSLPGLPRQKVIATVVRLLELTLVRVGNEEYAHANRSYGLTTLRNRHVRVDGSELRFRFKGKSGKEHSLGVRDRRVAAIVKKCQELPGQELFQYVDEAGQLQTVDSGDVNDYLREIAGDDFTAKDFRTWAGTVLAAEALKAAEAVETEAAAKRRVVEAIEQVARSLGNTAAVCRKCYVHPAIIESYLDGSFLDALNESVPGRGSNTKPGLPPEEAAVMALLRKRLAATVERPSKIA
jgi:DNA topoisomerase-1